MWQRKLMRIIICVLMVMNRLFLRNAFCRWFRKRLYRLRILEAAMRILTDPAETIDFAKIKLVVSEQTGKCLYMSRLCAISQRHIVL